MEFNMVSRNAKSCVTYLIVGLFFSVPAYAYDGYDNYLSLLGFKLGDASLIQIREELGDAELTHTGDAASSYYGLCYISYSGNATVIFESGEMGGGDHDLLSFVVKDGVDNSRKCGKLSQQYNDFSVGALSLGKNFELVKKQLPKPISDLKNGVQHKHFGKIPFSKQDIERSKVEDMEYAYWDVSIFIEAFETNGVVSEYKVSKVTSW